MRRYSRSSLAAVLAGGVLLSLAANLAQAQPTAWGRVVAAVPPAAFLVAVSMIERRAARRPRPLAARDSEAPAPGRPSPVRDAGDEEDEVLLALARRAAAEHQDATGSRSPATRCAPGSASRTRPLPRCCANSAPTRDCALSARRASGRVPGGGDGQRKWQTVYRDSRTCRPSVSSANAYSDQSCC